MKGKVQISEEAAVNNLRLFFANTPNGNEVSPQDIFVAMNRDDKEPEQNMSWLSNKLSSMRHYDLFERVYDKTKFGGSKLLKVVLTEKGSEALRRNELKEQADHEDLEEVGFETLETINHLISLVRKKMPNWELDLIDDQLVFRSKGSQSK